MEDRLDAELVRLARAGSKYAFNQLIERYQMMAMCIALRLCREEETARDLVQEAILQAFLSLDHLQDAARFKSWLYGIVLNVCRNWMRTVAQRQSLSLEALEEEHLHETLFSHSSDELSVDPQTIIEAHELRRLVQESLHLLSQKNRQVAQLFYYEDMSVQEIASSLNISQTAVKNRLYKGREQLRAHLQPIYPELAYRGANRSVEEKMIPVTLARVVQQDVQARSAVILLDRQKQRAMPLWFPHQENMNILQPMHSSSKQDIVAEPTTLDLMVAMLTSLDSEIKKVVIDALQGHILYAQLHLHGPHGKQTLKAHLHDALPLAVQLQSMFVVSEEVWQQRGIELEGKGATLEQQLDTVVELARNTFSPLTTKTSGELDFVDGLADWTIHLDRKHSDYRLDRQTTYTGKSALLITLQECQGFVELKHEDILAEPYHGCRICLVAYLKTEDVQRASLHLSVTAPSRDAQETFPAFSSAENEQPIESTQDWQRYELEIDVPDDAYSLFPWFNLWNKGKVWLDGFRIEVVDNQLNEKKEEQRWFPSK